VSGGSLRGVALRDLERLAKLLREGSLHAPITNAALLAAGLEHLASHLEWARALPAETLVDVVHLIIAERRAHTTTRAELVWTGPDVAASLSRDTAVVVRELLASVQRNAVIAGYSFDHGADILRPLHATMRSRGARVAVYLDVLRAPVGREVQAHLRDEIDRFLHENWPFGDPEPDLFFDPRTLPSDSVVSLHAKCIVVDDARALITSANFTDRGQHRNIEVGVLIEDAAFAAKLGSQWRALTDAGLMRRWRP
jgi:phosphatidylserine/phosphatidylglycerophosphate/cardiolipin synthase-like enzyme